MVGRDEGDGVVDMSIARDMIYEMIAAGLAGVGHELTQ
jgi:hypothetical protein